LNGQGGQEDRHEAVLAKRHTKIRMAGDLKEEPAIAPLIQELLLGQSPGRKTTKHKRPRAETQILVPLFALGAD
jgi:hypothetical protein